MIYFFTRIRDTVKVSVNLQLGFVFLLSNNWRTKAKGISFDKAQGNEHTVPNVNVHVTFVLEIWHSDVYPARPNCDNVDSLIC